MISNKDIRYEKSFYENLRKHYKNKARGYPEGALCFRFQHGTHRPFLNLNGKLTYLNKNNKRLISRLMEKRINESILKHIESNIKFLNRLTELYKGVEYILGDGVIKEIEAKIGRGFKVDDFLLPLSSSQSKKMTSNDPQSNTSQSDFHIENKKYKTPANIVVRSRAELVIATFLEMKGIDYIYEKPLKLFLKTVAPDFTIKRKSDGKIIIWEHFGMMDDPEYYESRMEVLSDYHHAGWLPYENFIATFGERNSPIDMTVIETICETMLR